MNARQPTEPMVTHFDACPLCQGMPEPFLLETHDLHYGIEGRWDYFRCKGCRVVFLNPSPTELFLSRAYDDSYYSYQDFKSPPGWQVALRRLVGYTLGKTGDPVFAKPGRVLDIGCGSGEFLHRMKLAGWDTHGVEISARAAEVGNERHALNIQVGTLASSSLPPESFDYIRLNHSFEHISNPRETLDLIRRYLAPTGLLFIGVPNVDGVQARIFRKYWWNLGPPVHPFNYGESTLRQLLADHGFEVVSFKTNSSFAGILGSAQMALNGRRGLRSDTGRLFTNPVAKVFTHWLAKLTDVFGAGDCLEIVARRRTPGRAADA